MLSPVWLLPLLLFGNFRDSKPSTSGSGPEVQLLDPEDGADIRNSWRVALPRHVLGNLVRDLRKNVLLSENTLVALM